MKPESTRVPESFIGSLSACLVEGDPEQCRRASKVRTRAFFVSVVLQTCTLAALIVFPLLGRGERIPSRIVYPLPPYRLGNNHPATGTRHVGGDPGRRPCYFCRTLTHGPTRPSTDNADRDPVGPPGIENNPYGDSNGFRYGIEPPHQAPVPPPDDTRITEQRHRITVGHIDPSRISHRVEPIYPILGVQLRRETRIELQAIIATDGSIQSLQVVSGDPIFYQSALNAVRQWRYTPTLLNDRPVEVDTHITIIYSLNR